MPTIIPNQDFKHGKETYEEGQSYEVSAEEAYYFKMSGWVGDEAAPSANATLDVQDQMLGHKAEV